MKFGLFKPIVIVIAIVMASAAYGIESASPCRIALSKISDQIKTLRPEITPQIAKQIEEYLAATANSLEKMRGENGLVEDTIWIQKREGGFSTEVLNPNASPTNIAVDLLVQSELATNPNSKNKTLALTNISRIASTLGQLAYHSETGLFYSRYATDHSSITKDYAVSAIDNLHLALALWTVKETFPKTTFGRRSKQLFDRMNFSVYYNETSGLIGGNLKLENGAWIKEKYNLDNLGSEGRLLYSAGWALGLFRDIKGDSEFLSKALSNLTAELFHSKQGDLLRLWDGSAFQLYFPKIFINEENYSSKLKDIYRAEGDHMIAEGKRRRLAVPAAHSPGWASLNRQGISKKGPSYRDKAGNINVVSSDNNDVSDPRLRKNWDTTFTPYAMFMAATMDPLKFLPIFSQMQDIKSDSNHLYLPKMGWMDGLQVKGPSKGQVIPAQLSLNQGMIALSLLQMLAPDGMSISSRALYDDPVIRGRLQHFYELLDEKLKGPQDENTVKIKNNQITINGEAQPQLYGAEFQYFRLRGGYDKNIPKEEVVKIWNRGLDQMVTAGMNTISFYIPWDFHEYAPGKFDFTGSVDEDGDGKPDYPSRDILTFLKLIEEHGIKRILLRPGPYVNAEWGFLGFGAVPEWFHKLYPESHMQNAQGLKTKLYGYHDPNFLRHTKLWFSELNRQVLSRVIGKGKPGIFLQLDNETNFQWQSIYNHDYSPSAIRGYRQFLANRYRNLPALNQSHGTSWKSWSEVVPPIKPGKDLAQDQDWYRFQDRSIFTYLKKIRSLWEEVGIREPNVIFTLAESFNAPKDGLLPNYNYKNKAGATGLMTINVYPKTWPAPANVLFHQPHKSDYDILAVAAANRYYLGSNQEAVIGPEIHTGWFGETVLTEQARQQTYLTLIGRGLKAQYFYYFNEGYNWQVEWGKNQILPFYSALHSESLYSKIPKEKLPDIFWDELQAKVDRSFMAGWNVKHVILEDVQAAQRLSFGAPLDGEAKPTMHFKLLEEIGQKIIKPYGEFLSKAVSIHDKVAILADPSSLTPSPIRGLDSRQMHSDFAGGLVGYVAQTGLNPRIHHWGINSTGELAKNKIIFIQDSGNMNPRLIKWLAKYVSEGGTVVSFIGDSVAKQISAPPTLNVHTQPGSVRLSNSSETVSASKNGPLVFDALASTISEYDLQGYVDATPAFFNGNKIVGYKYKYLRGQLVQIGAIIHDVFNSDAYGFLKDVPQRRKILDDLVEENNMQPEFRIFEGGDRIDVFGRKVPSDPSLWITVKSGLLESKTIHVQINQDLISNLKNGLYEIRNIMKGTSDVIDAKTLVQKGFPVDIEANGSAAFFVRELQ